MSRIGSRYFKLNVLRRIFDTKEKVHRIKGDEFTVNESRFFEIKTALSDKFKDYFTITQITMKKLIILAALSFFACSEEETCDTCTGRFINIETGEVTHQETDCDKTPPEGYAFVKCIDRPDY